jgi:citrate synthase
LAVQIHKGGWDVTGWLEFTKRMRSAPAQLCKHPTWRPMARQKELHYSSTSSGAGLSHMTSPSSREPTTSICAASADRIEVRGRDLCGDLMGKLSFTEYFYLLLAGREPTQDQKFFLDMLLVTIAEHGLTPTVQAARMTLASDPDSLQGALAAGLLGCGPVLLGTSDQCGKLLAEAQTKVAAGETPEAAAVSIVRRIHASGGRVPGFGHPVHRPSDPRTERILALADARQVSGPNVAMALQFRNAVAAVWGKPLVMNVSMPIAAVLLDLDFPPATIKAIPLLARTAGLLAHLWEERQSPTAWTMAAAAEHAVPYRSANETASDHES